MIKGCNYIVLVFILLVCSSCTFMYVPLIPANPQIRDARFLMSESEGLSVEAEQLRLDVSIEEIPESDWLAVQWFNPLSKEVASDSKWLEVSSIDGQSLDSQSLRFELPEDIALTPGYWRAVVSYQGRLIRQFGFDYVLQEDEVSEAKPEATELNEDGSSETNSGESSNESTEKQAN